MESDGRVPWRYASASVIGTAHLDTALPCQDACMARQINEEVLLLVLSDGAGSATHSDEGATLVCSSLLELVTGFFQGNKGIAEVGAETAYEWFGAIVDRLHKYAATCDLQPRDLACTLVAALLAPEASVFLHLGDGAIVTCREGHYEVASWPDNGEYANTTYFITDDRAIERLRVLLREPPADEIALFSDGLQMLALQFSTRQPHTPFFDPMFSRLRCEQSGESATVLYLLADYLNSPVINGRTDDDKTLILASRALQGARDISVTKPSVSSRVSQDAVVTEDECLEGSSET